MILGSITIKMFQVDIKKQVSVIVNVNYISTKKGNVLIEEDVLLQEKEILGSKFLKKAGNKVYPDIYPDIVSGLVSGMSRISIFG